MHRKVVTVVFCDVVGSTALGESVDPEALQGLLARYFERMKAIVESHGGSVEKFIGDAVMAVFGIPAVHEDDALRACRAAVEMREAFPELGVEGRIGVNTGEVVTGTEERLATGDAVNVAARLQQAAEPDEVLIGEATLELARDAVEAERMRPLELKGKSEPVAAHRLVAVLDAPERSHESRFVGRGREVGLIHEAWTRAQSGHRCELVTIVGDPGVGKSRLVAEAVNGIGANTVRGRCLPYGEGITYWPVVEAIKQLGSRPSDPYAAGAIASLLRESDLAVSAEEIAWSFRKLLEEAAPLVVVFDDIQWGEETFLDLVEGVALLSSGTAILLVCIARPELLDRRPQWAPPVRLEPLGATAVTELIGDLPAELHDRIAAAAGGNPLFLTEMLAMADEGAQLDVPPTLRALLAARLDRLEPAERRVLEGGAVEGEIFHRGTVQALAPEEQQITPRLSALVRRELIRPDRAQLPGEDGFRFRHILIRDATYDALPKAARAELHQRFADWLESRGADLVELDEIVGYHLEQAARYKHELGKSDAALAVRAGDRLAAAGRRALVRGDLHAGRSLLERALLLTRPVRLDVHLELDLADAYHYVPRERLEVTEQAVKRARDAGDAAAEALALVADAHARSMFTDDVDAEELEQRARTALPLLEQAGDHAGLAQVWFALAYGVYNTLGRYEEMTRAAEQSLREAALGGEVSFFRLAGLPMALRLGPCPADEALEKLDSILPPNPEPDLLMIRAALLAMLGRFDEAWSVGLPAAERWRELGGEAEHDDRLAEIAEFAGDHSKAAEYLRGMCDMLERRDSRGYLSTYAPMLGRSLCALGRYEEAEARAIQGRDLGAEDDFITQMLWRQVLARVHAHRADYAEAERLARAAVAIGEQTDALIWQADALRDLAEVLAAAGLTEEAADALEQALDRYERKKNLPMAAQVRQKLQSLSAGGHP